MDYPLTLPALARRAEQVNAARGVAWRRPDGSLGATSWGAVLGRARRLAVALQGLGIGPGDTVATFCWNHREHLEAYYAAPALGAVLHTLNIRLHADELAYIANHAGDRIVIADASLLPQLEAFRERAPFKHVVLVGAGGPGEPPLPAWAIGYEELLARVPGEAPAWDDLPGAGVDERDPATCCYTSGTTGMPKGVLLSHRGVVLHALTSCTADSFALSQRDSALAVVPMFHVNAWGLPFSCAMTGAKMVLPGPRLDAASLLELIEHEGVTMSAGVPTVFLPLLTALDEAAAAGAPRDVRTLRSLVIGGSAAPQALIEGFQERHGVEVVHAWGMTELGPIGTIGRVPARLDGASAAERYRYRAKQGRPVANVEVRAVGDDGLVPWDGESFGELEVRGTSVISAYTSAEGADRFSGDGWFRTGDIVTIDPDGTIEIRDRAKDLIKSGGEWISSVALENALMGHPAVAEAAVVAIADERWGERPLACVVLRPGAAATAEELRAHLEPSFARWWLPERFAFVDAIPRTATGKFKKTALREQFGSA